MQQCGGEARPNKWVFAARCAALIGAMQHIGACHARAVSRRYHTLVPYDLSTGAADSFQSFQDESAFHPPACFSHPSKRYSSSAHARSGAALDLVGTAFVGCERPAAPECKNAARLARSHVWRETFIDLLPHAARGGLC